MYIRKTICFLDPLKPRPRKEWLHLDRKVKTALIGEIENIIDLKYTYSDFYLLQYLLQRMEGKWIAFSGCDKL